MQVRSSSCRAVERAESTAAVLLPRATHQPSHRQQQEAAGEAESTSTERVRVGVLESRVAGELAGLPERTWIRLFVPKSLE